VSDPDGSARDGLQGRTALVTGASRGIGLAIAEALVGSGMWVGMVARGKAALDAAAKSVGGHAIAADASSASAVHGLASYVAELLGGEPPDLVVNAAGAFALAPLARTDPDVFEAQLAANLRAPFLVTRAFLPLMLRRGSGHLIQIGSVAGRVAFPENGAYAASKFGLRGMHEVLLQEVRGTGVRATLVEPAATDTPLWDPIDPDSRADLPNRSAMLRPEDVARVVVFAAAQPRHVQIPFVAVEAAG
jgi:NAD(P)-dependent dehydrogenase (short-subunit alcohol dehydrogenase family)